ncbi:uncharacterized protein [Oscarella lobularis]|uniref:uncharacterized protein n=1 Tax=Oscarella lobularis TaxID=121494 RepID=UPI0033130A11
MSTRYRLRHAKMELNPNEAKVDAFKENLRQACDLLSLPKPDAEGAEQHLLTCERTKECLRPHQLPDAKYLIEMYYHLARAIKLQGFHRWADVDRCLFEARRVFDSSDQYRNKSIAHPLKALVCFMHGRLFFYAGEEKFEDAERLLKEACDIFYALNRSEDNEALASALSYTALIFWQSQRYEEARQAIDRAKYAFHSKSLEKSRRGEDSDLDPRIGQALYAQGLLHYAQGNLPLAQKDLQEALSSYEKVLPDTHPLIGADNTL